MDPNSKYFRCTFCEKSYKYDQTLKKHIREAHDKTFSRKKHMKCPGCEEAFHFRKDLRAHISSVHGEPMEVEEFTFENFQEFELWKDDMERRMKCSYYKCRSGKMVQAKEVHQYSCHRSGVYSGKSKRQREMKSVGSKKMNAYCPSSMDVVVMPDEVYVKFWKTHYGHKNEIGHVWLSREEKFKIAEKLKQGASFQQILDEFRDSFSGEDINRIDLLCRKDLHNIARCFRIFKQDKLSVDDTKIIRSWVELMKCAQHDSPIVYFKERGVQDPDGYLEVEDFQLIIMAKYQEEVLKKSGHLKVCIDNTLGTNSYEFQLIILLTIDEFGCGCPVSYCFTNRYDEAGMEVFFNAVKEKICIMHANVFMSHDAPAFYDAWCKVMGPTCYQLLCSWHVDSSWRKNLQKIHGTPEKKIEVYQTLRLLLQESDTEKFELLHSRFMDALVEDEDTKQFAAYFKKFYSDRCKLWALCYRLHLGLNTNDYMEGVHKRIKSCYLEGGSTNKVDNMLSMLLKISRDECLKRLVNISDNECSSKLKLSEENHINQILEHMVIPIEENHWSIRCSDDNTSNYDIKKLDDPICINKCGLVCDKCAVCIHMFECTCLDNFVRCIICEHIHACASKPVCVTETESDEEMDACANNDSSNSTDFIENVIRMKTDRLKRELETTDLSEVDQIEINKSLDYCLSVCGKARGNSCTEPVTKKRKPEIICVQKAKPPTKTSPQKPTILFVSKPDSSQAKPELPSISLPHPLPPQTAILLVPKPDGPPRPKILLIPTPQKGKGTISAIPVIEENTKK